jgi:hypothetical protein
MITISIATRSHLRVSTSDLRYDCKKLVQVAFRQIEPRIGRYIATTIQPAKARDLGSIDALIQIGVSDAAMPDEERITLSDALARAIVAANDEDNPGLRVSVMLSLQLEVDQTYGVIEWPAGWPHRGFEKALDQEVKRLQGLRARKAS